MEDFHNPELQQHACGRAIGRRVRTRGGGGVRGRHNGGRGGKRRVRVSDEIRATLVDHVINRGFTMEEAGRRVQPNVNRSTVSSIVQTFRRENRTAQQPRTGGRAAVFNHQQEQEICNMIIANNSIRLREIQSAIINDNNVFANINSVSISTIDRVLKRHQMTMKQLYKVPFERNSERVKELRYQYVQYSFKASIDCSCFNAGLKWLWLEDTEGQEAQGEKRGAEAWLKGGMEAEMERLTTM
ncbi:uncharacterized protein LOC131525677 [Onychostoma macrolepis]|uniref:uncharacterized protein LOC131525677 n=1 Tax=Onychostoma macrolepis TaxID=369639 RepID=UPI00272CCB39|nr:uncharacterized protein LOC131525677 [Onychostoma macrolepis]